MTIQLKVKPADGSKAKVFEGWQRIRVDQSLDRLVGGFSFEASYAYEGAQYVEAHEGMAGGDTSYYDTHLEAIDSGAYNGMMGAEVKVLIDKLVLMQGYVDYFPIQYDGRNHRLWIAGRDKTCDLVDCSYVGNNEWQDAKVQDVIRDVCRPYAFYLGASYLMIESAAQDGASREITGTYKIKEGAYAYEHIKSLCKKVGIFPVSYGDGKLTLTTIGPSLSHDNLELGVNILSGSLEQSDRDRYSDYIVKGNRPVREEDGDLEAPFRPKGTAEDSIFTVMERYRPRVIISEEPSDEEACQKRAEWEAAVNAGKSREAIYTVQGWLMSNGMPWQMNTLVTVKDSFFGFDGKEFVISGVSFRLEPDTGKTTRITVSRKEKYSTLADQNLVGNVRTRFDS